VPDKQWTVLVWIAGDNDLDEFGLSDLAEMKQVGSTDDVDVVVQFDRMGDDVTRRYHVTRNGSVDDDVVEELGETNTGDPQVAIDFLTWGIERYPSDKVLAVIWNHGSGIDEADVYARASARGMTVARRAEATATTVPREQVREIVSSDLRRSVFITTVESALMSKAIAYDDTSRDFLDNAELKRVLEEVVRTTGKPIDVLGFDACLMNLVEIAYQLRGLAGHVVGSEEVEPEDGWPYADVVGGLADSPWLAPADAAKRLVQSYADSYTGGESVTQSALDLSRIVGVTTAVDELASVCMSTLETTEDYAVFARALKNTQRFRKRDFADLAHFCALLSEGSSRIEVQRAARRVYDSVLGDRPFVIASGRKGTAVERATGAAVYFPIVGDVQVAYEQLDFAQDTRWNALIAKYRDL
jgi:hypothetical protein